MTRFILRFALITTVTSSLLVALLPFTTRYIPIPQPDYWDRFGFSTCELPCYAGMTPGMTSFEQVPMLLDQNVPALLRSVLVSGSQINFMAVYDPYAASGLIQPAMGTVGRIQLSLRVELIDLIERLGVPDCVWVDPNPAELETIVLYWSVDRVVIGATVAEPLFQPPTFSQWWNHFNVIGMVFSIDNPEAPLCSDPAVVGWHGFAPVWRYIEFKRLP